jgi:hypothetical protein
MPTTARCQRYECNRDDQILPRPPSFRPIPATSSRKLQTLAPLVALVTPLYSLTFPNKRPLSSPIYDFLESLVPPLVSIGYPQLSTIKYIWKLLKQNVNTLCLCVDWYIYLLNRNLFSLGTTSANRSVQVRLYNFGCKSNLRDCGLIY